MEEKCVKMPKSRIFRQKPVGGTSTTTFSSPVLTYFCTVKSRICIPMFRDPKKGIMGIQISVLTQDY